MIPREIVVSTQFVRIFGIPFLRGGYPAVKRRLGRGGLMIAPSAPSLVPIGADAYYHAALRKSDLALADSGLMVLLLKLLFRVELQRLSGLEFLQNYLGELAVGTDTDLFLVEPSVADHEANMAYLARTGVPCKPYNYYVAPHYRGRVLWDAELLERIEYSRPTTVLINLGGGVQERLGYFLRENLSFRPAILCTGAAIAFLSGRQAAIPAWADRLYLGWLFRCCSEPRKFIPRYLGGIRLIPMLSRCVVRKS